MTPKSAEEVARDCVENGKRTPYSPIDEEQITKNITQALRAARRDGVATCARIVEKLCDDPSLRFNSAPGVTRCIADALRALASSDEEKGGG